MRGARSVWRVDKRGHHAMFKGTQVLSGKSCQADARRRFGNIYVRLGNRVRDFQPRSVFPSFRNIDANEQGSRAFLPFFARFWAQQPTTPHENEIFWPAGFSGPSREELHRPRGEHQTRR